MISIAIVAYAACDMVHEVLGHGLACALSGIRALSLSTVALQTASSSRVVAAAGSIANVLVGGLSLFALWRGTRPGAARYFFWLFASVNLLNGTGYPLFSAVLDFGDWAVVIAGLEPDWAWRVVVGGLGGALYAGTIVLMAAMMVRLVQRGSIDRGEVPRLVFAAYVAGGVLLVAGAALNPVGPRFILLSGVSSGFGAMAGLTAIPAIVDARTTSAASAGAPIRFSAGWVAAGLGVAIVFIGLLGPGISLVGAR